jgi:hypothetical protein
MKSAPCREQAATGPVGSVLIERQEGSCPSTLESVDLIERRTAWPMRRVRSALMSKALTRVEAGRGLPR